MLRFERTFSIFRAWFGFYGWTFFELISLCMICIRRSGDLYCLGSEWCNFSSRSQHTVLLSRSGFWPSWSKSFIALQYSGYFASSSPIVSVADCMLYPLICVLSRKTWLVSPPKRGHLTLPCRGWTHLSYIALIPRVSCWGYYNFRHRDRCLNPISGLGAF